jgi:nucleotide-binding universal stress UspA family protein
MMKNVLVLVHDDPGQEARLQAAIDLVRALDGHLTCLDVLDVALEAGYSAPEVAAVMVEQEQAAESANRARLEDRLSKEDVPWTIREAIGSFANSLRDAAGLSDLIVLNAQLEETGPDMRGIASALLLKARKPVVIAPQQSRGFDTSGPAMVAWDGSLPAMAALTAAVPLLKLASSVRILEIQGSSKGGVQEAASYLSRHGVHAEVDLVACFKDAPHEPSAVIQDMCEKEHCTYVVMGAYGHSPLRETLLGGVTRRMLGSARVPVFLAH